MKTQMEILGAIIKCVDEDPVSFMALCRETGFNYRTVKRHIELIEFLQHRSPKIEIQRDGFRVVIRKIQEQPTVG